MLSMAPQNSRYLMDGFSSQSLSIVVRFCSDIAAQALLMSSIGRIVVNVLSVKKGPIKVVSSRELVTVGSTAGAGPVSS
jgi:hypothetical protein